MTEIRHVVPATGGGWLVVEDTGGAPARHDNTSTETFDRKRDAAATARAIVRRHGGGEVVLHTPAGRIVEVDTVVNDDPPLAVAT